MPDGPAPDRVAGADELSWPLRLSRPRSDLGDGPEVSRLAHRSQLEVAVESLDDVDHDYRCHDARGRRLRLVVARHTLLYATVVDEDWHRGRLSVVQTHSAWGDPVLAERSDGVVTRVLEIEPNGHRTPEPNWPHPLRADADLGAAPSDVTPEQFHRWWTISTQARPHRRHRTGWWGRFGVGTDVSE